MPDSELPRQSEATRTSFRWLSAEVALSLIVWLLTVVWVAAVIRTEVAAQGTELGTQSVSIRHLTEADAVLRQQSAILVSQVAEHERRLRELELLNRQLLDTTSRIDENIKIIKFQLASQPGTR